MQVGDVQWRLKVWPKGDDAAGGTHLSGESCCRGAPTALLTHEMLALL